jgi:hypothetical protein
VLYFELDCFFALTHVAELYFYTSEYRPIYYLSIFRINMKIKQYRTQTSRNFVDSLDLHVYERNGEELQF